MSAISASHLVQAAVMETSSVSLSPCSSMAAFSLLGKGKSFPFQVKKKNAQVFLHLNILDCEAKETVLWDIFPRVTCCMFFSHLSPTKKNNQNPKTLFTDFPKIFYSSISFSTKICFGVIFSGKGFFFLSQKYFFENKENLTLTCNRFLEEEETQKVKCKA